MLFVLDVYKIQSVQEAGIFLQGGVLFSLFNFTLADIFTLGKIKAYIFLSLYQDKFSEHQAFQDIQPTPPERPTDRSVCFGIQFSPSLLSSCLCQQCGAFCIKQIRALKMTGHHHLLMSSVTVQIKDCGQEEMLTFLLFILGERWAQCVWGVAVAHALGWQRCQGTPIG